MDGVSATASIIAVSSLAFHAAASTKKALDFWDSIQHAPEEVEDIRTTLEILRDVLEQIGHEAQHAPSSPSTLPVLSRCSRKIDSIVSLTTKFESGLKSSKIRTRKYSALRAVLKREKIKKAQDLLSSSKQDLTLVSIYNTGLATRLRDEHQAQDMQTLSRQLDELKFQDPAQQVARLSNASTMLQNCILGCTQEMNNLSNSESNNALPFGVKSDTQKAIENVSDFPSTGSTCSNPSSRFDQSTRSRPFRTDFFSRHTIKQYEEAFETFFGTFRISSRTNLVSYNHSEYPASSERQDRLEHEKTFRLSPTQWLARFGFTWGLSGCFSQMPFSKPTITLDVLRNVPDSAEIFKLCNEGNLERVQALLSEGRASVKDVDSQGRTPLYVAAGSHHAELCKFLICCGADRDSRIYEYTGYNYLVRRNPLFAIANIYQYESPYYSGISYDPDRVIDTFRLFIDLVDVWDLSNDHWTSALSFLKWIAAFHPHSSEEATAADTFLWTLEELGPDFWQSLNEFVVHGLLYTCLSSGRKEWTLRLLQICNYGIDARSVSKGCSEGYSPLHELAFLGQYLEFPLTLGADVNLVGDDLKFSPWSETPLSLSMYRADTFVALQSALKSTKARLEVVVDEALKKHPFLDSRWTEETLMELLSIDLDFLPIITEMQPVCPYCLDMSSVMVQPYWMLILEFITRRTGSQSILNVIEDMLSRDFREFSTDAESEDDDGNEEAYSHPHMQVQNNALSKAEDQHFTALNEEPMPVQSGLEPMGDSIMCDISIEEEDMCLFCWQTWMDTGLKPLIDESECLCCGFKFSSEECLGKADGRLWCYECETSLPKKEKERRVQLAEIESDEEEDEYSPYLIHT